MIHAKPEPPPNALRYAGAPGHVESYFLRANDPNRPRAIWLKATVFAPLEGEAQVESWFLFFDADRPAPIAGRETSPFRSARFAEANGSTHVFACRLTLDLSARGSARGEVRTPAGEGRVDLAWEPSPSAVGAPLSLLRPRAVREGPFPRSKLLTPFPSLRFSGHIQVGEERIDVRQWLGMQGHNWGREHAFEYAWGQALFPATANEPEAMVEGFSARVRVGGLRTPRVSCLVVRRGEQTLRFDRLFDLWRQEAELDTDRWSLRLLGSDGEARLEMDAAGRPIACLGYRNPDERLSYCFNSKLARVRLQVQPASGAAFACESAHGGALEFLRNEPDPRFPDVV
jgi:hypothetical protein